jgi:hypothetical protein
MTARCGMYPKQKAGYGMSLTDHKHRFTVTSTELRDLPGIDLWFALYPLEESDILLESWLAQAHSMFSQLGIHEDDWKNYGTF